MHGDSLSEDEFGATYEATTVAIAQARSELATWLHDCRVADDVSEEMVIVLSELLANAVSASTDPSSEVAVACGVDDESITLEVTNPPASKFSSGDRWDYDDPLRPGGRGLVIVESLVDDVSVSVRCRRERRTTPAR